MRAADVQGVVLGVVAGLALFLYGVDQLARAMRALAGDRSSQLLALDLERSSPLLLVAGVVVRLAAGRRDRLREAGAAVLGLGLVLFGMHQLSTAVAPLTALVRQLGGDTARQIADAHVAFNVLGALAALPFLGLAGRALTRLVPERPAPHVPEGLAPQPAGA